MTRDMAHAYRDADSRPGGDPTRFDMPPETFRLVVGGLPDGVLRASAADPLTGVRVPIEIDSRGDGTAVVELPLTDSPRLLKLAVDVRAGRGD
jgi:hypothetical protein